MVRIQLKLLKEEQFLRQPTIEPTVARVMHFQVSHFLNYAEEKCVIANSSFLHFHYPVQNASGVSNQCWVSAHFFEKAI